MDDLHDQVQFIIDKVFGLAQLEEGEEGKNEERINDFRIFFPSLAAEKFVTCEYSLGTGTDLNQIETGCYGLRTVLSFLTLALSS